MTNLKQWARQPTTVAGISALAGTAVAVALGQMTLGAALPLISGAIISMLLPDNTTAKQEAADLAKSLAAVVAKPGASA